MIFLLFGCETWKIRRKIYGHTKTEVGYWRIKTNQEINDILRTKYNWVY
jgi:hypothetical protein